MKMKLLVGAAMLLGATPVAAQTKPVIRTRSDLPPVRFALAVPPSQAVMTPAFTAQLGDVRREAERLLRDYAIEDATIVQELRLGLAVLAALEGRDDDAARAMTLYRAAEVKPQGKAVGGMMVDLAAAIGDTPDRVRCDAAAARLSAMLRGTDPALVRDQFLGTYSNIRTMSVPFMVGTAAGGLDPIHAQRGSLGVEEALTLALFRLMATRIPPCRDALGTAARAWLDAPANQAVNIWPQRQPDASALAAAKPVVVAVWDSGFDATLFPGQLARDPAEPLDGRDNDGNGVVDDSNGPTYDAYLKPRAGTIMAPTRFLQQRLAAQMAYDKGELDLRFGLDTPEAAQFAAFAQTADVAAQGDEYLAFQENRGRIHGTACASEIADDAPYVRLYNVAALPWGRGEDRLDIPYDEATIARWAAAIGRIGARMRGASVRVVNMSWGLTADEITRQLLDRGLEKDAGRAKARGVAMQRTIGDALEAMMRASPGILFVSAAGNSNQADAVQADAVQRLRLPNLLIVGATGTNGRPTGFTVTGPSVALYAQGEAVRLRWPGDIVAHASGTSMAAPLVVRAAAQMLAVKPSLTPVQVRDGLLASATPGDAGIRLIHPAAAVRWAAAR
jgi:subtilisin family serine protease